jgi:tape measure domain-containing protein
MTDVGAGGLVGSARIEVRATVDRLRRDMQASERIVSQSLSSLSRSADRTERSLGRVGRGFKREIDEANASVRSLNASLQSVSSLASSALAGAAGAIALQNVTRLADQYANLEARVRLVLDATDDLASVQDRLFRLAQQTSAPLEDITNLYVRLRQSIAGLGDSEAQSIARVFAQTLTISGATTQETSSFLVQISQALASGVLRGEEFNAVMESNARFAGLLADQLGVGVGELRALAEGGQLTADVIRATVAGGSAEIAAEAAQLPLTIGRAVQQLENAFARYVGQTDSALGASQRLAAGIQSIADNIDDLAAALTVVGTLVASSLGGRAIGASANAAREIFSLAASATNQQIAATLSPFQSSVRTHRALLNEYAEGLEIARRNADGLRGQLSQIDEAIRRISSRPYPTQGSNGENLFFTQRRFIEQQERDLADAREARRLVTQRLARAENELSMAGFQHGRTLVELRARERLLETQTQRLGGAYRATTLAISGVRAAGSQLVSLMGGPWGVAIAALSFAFIATKEEADRAANAITGISNALGIIASASPAQNVSDETRALADSAREAAVEMTRAREASDNLNESLVELEGTSLASADATNIQAEASRALSAARQLEAINTTRAAIAESQRLLASLEARNRSQIANETLYSSYPSPFASEDRRERRMSRARAEVAEREGQIESIRRMMPILERGLEALESGELFADLGATSGGYEGQAAAAILGGGASALSTRIEALREFVRLGGDMAEALRRAADFGGNEATQAIDALLQMPEALGELGRVSDPVLRFTETLERLSELRGAAGEAGAGAFDREVTNAIYDMASAAEDGTEALENLQRAVDGGLVSPELADAARNSLSFLGDDFDRARRIVRESRSELEGYRRELAEIQRLSAAGIFDEIGGSEAEAFVELLERMARAAGDASEAMALLANNSFGEKFDIAGAERRIRDAAREGRFEEDEAAGLYFRVEDIRDIVSDGLYDAFRTGGWREAFASSINNVMSNVLRRVANALANMVVDAVMGSTGGGSNFISQGISAIAGGFGGKRAVGGPVKSGLSYVVNEGGRGEVFIPGADGYIASNRAMREAMGAANSGPPPVQLNVRARTDGTVFLEIQAAEQRATVAGGKAGAEAVSRMLRARSSV